MGAAGDLRAHQSRFRVEYIRVNALQIIAALIVIAVAGGGDKMGGVDSVLLHGRENFALIVFGDLVDGFETLPQVPENGLAVFIHSPADAQLLIHRSNIHVR